MTVCKHPTVTIERDLIVEPSMFWFWNVTPTHDSICERLDALRDKGIAAVHIHPMPHTFRLHDFHGGMEVPYLSPEFFDLIKFACEQIKQRDMTLWLYDEGGWPSGMADGQLVAQNPQFGMWALKRQNGQVTPVQFLNKKVYPDLMNPQATECFINLTHERYRKAIGEHFGKTVRGIFTDEPRISGMLGTDMIPWSPTVPDKFTAMHGYPLDEALDALFEGSADDPHIAKHRHRYIATFSTLITENYFTPIRRWCDAHDLLFEGHQTGDNHVSQHAKYFGDFLQQAAQYHIPGVDTIWRQIFPGEPRGNYVCLASSSAWAHGKRYAMSESFAVYGAGLTLEQMQWVIAYQLVRGINKFIFMPMLHNVQGPQRIGTCADISPHQPQWRDIDPLIDIMRRAANFTLTGTPQPTVGIYYRSELVDDLDTDRFAGDHEAMCNRVLDTLNAIMFVGLNELKNAQLRDGHICIGDIQLAVLMIHADSPLDDDEQATLDTLKAQGVRVLIPTDDESPLLEAALVQADRPLTGVRVLPLRTEHGLNLLLFNQNDQAVTFTLQIKHESSTLHEYILDDSTLAWCDPIHLRDDSVTVKLQPGQLRALVTTKQTNDAPPTYTCQSTQPLTADWRVKPIEQYIIDDDIRVEPCNTPWQPTTPAPGNNATGSNTVNDPHFSGSLLYECTFEVTRQPGARYTIDLGDVHESCELMLNGQSMGCRAWRPHAFELTDALRDGKNTVQVRVTNTLANQWLEPSVHERDCKLWPSPYMPIAKPFMAQCRPCQLIGPIVLSTWQTSSRNTD